MRAFNNSNKTRMKIAVYTNLFLGVLAISCVFLMNRNNALDLSSVITACVGGVLTITTMYIGGDSYRKSK